MQEIILGFLIFILVAIGAVTVVYFMNDKVKKEQSANRNFTVTAHTGCMKTKDNSIDSIIKAYENHADIVEFDLNFTSSGEPVLSHDEPNGNEVSLDEAFKKISEYRDLKVNVDVKSVANLTQIKPCAEKYGIADRIFFTGIKDEFVLSASKTDVEYYLNVDVKKPSQQTDDYLQSLVNKVISSGAVGINLNKKNFTSKLSKAFHENNLLVSVWTLNSKREIKKAISCNPDNITTKWPNLFM